MKQRAAAFLIACLPALLGVSFAGAAFAGFEEALRSFERKDDAKALAELRPLAEQGHARAQNNLGVMYENGRGVPQNAVIA